MSKLVLYIYTSKLQVYTWLAEFICRKCLNDIAINTFVQLHLKCYYYYSLLQEHIGRTLADTSDMEKYLQNLLNLYQK